MILSFTKFAGVPGLTGPDVIRIGSRAVLILSALLLVLLTACSGKVPAETNGKVTIGPVESVELLPWGIPLAARIDTGAHTSSLFAKDVTVSNGVVAFRFPESLGGKGVQLAEWLTIKSSDGVEEKRPVVFVKIRMANKIIHTRVTLDDRSRMAYPMLIGRRTLRGHYVVDVARVRHDVPDLEGGAE